MTDNKVVALNIGLMNNNWQMFYKGFMLSVQIDGVEYFPLTTNSGGDKTAFDTREKAEAAAKEWKLPANSIFIVTKNVDFTEGRGPNLLHKVFKSMKNAHDYIMQQGGIYGSQQFQELSFGCNIYGGAYASNRYNGYAIEIMQIEDAE